MNKSIFSKIIYVFDNTQRLRGLLLFIIIAIGAFVELVGVGAVLPFITVVISPEAILDNWLLSRLYRTFGFSDTRSFIIFLGLAIIAIYILKNVYVYFMHSFQYRFTYENQRALSLRMMKCYISQPYLFHVEHNSAELIRNVNEDVVSFFEAILACLQLASEGGVCLALTILLLVSDPYITLGVMIFAGIFAILFLKVFRKRLRQVGRLARDEQALTKQTLLEALGSIKEIKVLGREGSFTDLYDLQYRNYAESNRRYKIYSMIPKPVMETLAISGILLVVCVRIGLGDDTASFIPTMSLFAVAAFRMLPSANRMAEYLSRLLFTKPAIDAIYHDLKLIEKLGSESVPGASPGKITGFDRDIQVDEIEFRYPRGERDIFKGASITIPKNASVALIGASGGGKTTLADIILGLLEPASGRVLIDGRDIREDMAGYRKLLGYIPQSISLIDATIRENIVFGSGAVREEDLKRAIRDAQLEDFIASLPEGLDTMTGEAGMRLSGGQRQRIGIARALYDDPQILVLDEATSALDNDTEAAVMEAIDHLAGHKTLIIIAHRLSTIQNCDMVYRIEKGEISLTH